MRTITEFLDTWPAAAELLTDDFIRVGPLGSELTTPLTEESS